MRDDFGGEPLQLLGLVGDGGEQDQLGAGRGDCADLAGAVGRGAGDGRGLDRGDPATVDPLEPVVDPRPGPGGVVIDRDRRVYLLGNAWENLPDEYIFNHGKHGKHGKRFGDIQAATKIGS